MSDQIQHMPVSQPLLSDRQDNARTLIIVLAIMAFLASLALLFSLSAQRLQSDWQGELGRTATVQLMLDNTAARETKINTAVTALKESLPNAKIRALSQSESAALLKPWLGNVALPDDLPLPALISIEMDQAKRSKNDKINIQQVIAVLGEEGLIAEVDDHSRYSDQIGQTGRGLLAAATALLMLIFGAAVAVSNFATQAALSAQRDVIRVLVQVGATDKFIRRLFVRQAGLRGLKGAFIGVVLGAITAIFLSLRGRSDTALLPDLRLHWTDSFGLLLLILGFALFCAISAGMTAYRILVKERRRL